MATRNTPTTQSDIVVFTAITDGSLRLNDVEGVVVSTAITAGSFRLNHAEAIVGSTPVPAGIVVRTGIVGGPKRIFIGSLS